MAILYTAMFVSDLVRNPEDIVSHDAAQIISRLSQQAGLIREEADQKSIKQDFSQYGIFKICLDMNYFEFLSRGMHEHLQDQWLTQEVQINIQSNLCKATPSNKTYFWLFRKGKLMHELSAVLSCSNKQPPVNSDSMSPE